MSWIGTVAYLLLFAGGAFAFLLVTLSLGWLLRARKPSATKLAAYECGEPAVGPGYLQFDLRFYVVALVFLIFDVEVAFFFPWAVAFGKSNQITALEAEAAVAAPAEVGKYTAALVRTQGELGVPAAAAAATGSTAKDLARAAMIEMGIFFGILLLGYAYVWSRGDLDWVRALPPAAAGTAVGGASED